MKLLLRRSQRPGIFGWGKVRFTLSIRAELTDQERRDIRKYKFSKVLLYERTTFRGRIIGWLGLAAFVHHRLTNLTISVKDLEYGKRVSCKDILHMLSVENEIKEAAQTFKVILRLASTFDGEEVIELA